MCYGSILSDSLCRAAKSVRCWSCDRIIDKGKMKRVIIQKVEGERGLQSAHYCEVCSVVNQEDVWSEGECVVAGERDIRDSVRGRWKKVLAWIREQRQERKRK